ncbi:MAG: HEPN domain-containing protein [Hyphomonadaceae bacterium]|nr:HEPN domain-containing protein [Hyphomonadaceae bacterium]
MSQDGDSEDRVAAAAWFTARWQPGRWLAIAPGEDIPVFLAAHERTFAHMSQLAFTPEIERRIAAGTLPDGFMIDFAQQLQPPDRKPLVRFNDEVRGIVKLSRDAPAHEEGHLTGQHLEHIEAFDLVDDELDCGHFTAYFTGRAWAMTFDFRSGRAKALHYIERASQFAATARFSIEKGFGSVATDNLFSACELLSKVQLMLHQSPAARAKTHGPIGSAINAWGRLGNVAPDFLQLFNRLSNDRAPARYDVSGDFEPSTLSDVEIVERIAEDLRLRVSPRV